MPIPEIAADQTIKCSSPHLDFLGSPVNITTVQSPLVQSPRQDVSQDARLTSPAEQGVQSTRSYFLQPSPVSVQGIPPSLTTLTPQPIRSPIIRVLSPLMLPYKRRREQLSPQQRRLYTPSSFVFSSGSGFMEQNDDPRSKVFSPFTCEKDFCDYHQACKKRRLG